VAADFRANIFQRPIRGAFRFSGDPVVFASLDHRLISVMPPASGKAAHHLYFPLVTLQKTD